MNTIKFNDLELEVESYNKNTYFNDGNITSTGYCTVITNDIASLNELMGEIITSIEIKHNDNSIYNLANLNAHIDTINESLSGDRIVVNLNITF